MKVMIVVLSLVVTACSSVPLNEAGRSVRTVRTTPTGCKYIGPVSGSANEDYKNPAEHMINQIKNDAAKLGANTVEITSTAPYSMIAEAYSCQ